jgi:hypothetical protein
LLRRHPGHFGDALPLSSALSEFASKWGERMIQKTLCIFTRYLSLTAIVTGFFINSSASFAGTVKISTVVFKPALVKALNPVTPGDSVHPQNLHLHLAAYDAFGNLIIPSKNNPITIKVYGAPAGVISPTSTSITSGASVTLAYNGKFFPNPITIEAYTANNGVGGQSIGVTQVLQKNKPPCVYGAQAFTIPFDCGGESDPACANDNLTGGLRVIGAIGYNNPTQQNLQDFTIDTGSLGAVVPLNDLGPDAIGPAGPGVKFYNSSGNTFAGSYYLAPISLQNSDGVIVQTNPILVLAVDAGFCAPGYPNCTPPGTDIHYLGVGFDRNNTTAGDAFDSPADNAFLEITDANNGTDISPGYILSGDDATIGITDISKFKLAPLTPNTSVPGDWNAVPGCYQFPTLSGHNQFCGNLLLDVGIDEMFLDLVKSKRPAGAVDSRDPTTLPIGLKVSILAGKTTNPALSYSFEYTPSTPATGVGPTKVTWINSPKIFVNTGRDVLFGDNYMFDGRCGNVGFQSLQ